MKRAILIVLSVILVTVITVSGTLAFSTDGVNTVSDGTDALITLVEQQRAYDENGTLVGLQPFEDEKMLLPLIGSAQGEKDRFGLPTAANYVDKIVNVQNNSDTPMYVRVIAAIPAALDNTQDAGNNALHWNLGNRFDPQGEGRYNAEVQNPGYADIDWKFSETAAIDGRDYNLYIFTYKTPLAAGKTTAAPAFVGFYLDPDVDYDETVGSYTLDGKTLGYGYDDVKIPVEAQAVEASAEFADAAAAFAASPDNPWA